MNVQNKYDRTHYAPNYHIHIWNSKCVRKHNYTLLTYTQTPNKSQTVREKIAEQIEYRY